MVILMVNGFTPLKKIARTPMEQIHAERDFIILGRWMFTACYKVQTLLEFATSFLDWVSN